MAFITQNLIVHDPQFQIGVDLGSDHLPIEISIDTTAHRNTFTNHTRYKFDQTDREVFESILEEALGSEDFSGHLSTSDLDRYADFIITALHNSVDKAIPKSKGMRAESNPISNETLVPSRIRIVSHNASDKVILPRLFQIWRHFQVAPV